MLPDYVASKILDEFICLCKNLNNGSEKFQSLDFALESAITDYAKINEKDTFYQNVKNILQCDIKALQKILDKAIPSREVLDDLVGFFAGFCLEENRLNDFSQFFCQK